VIVTNEQHRFLVADQLAEIGIDAPRIILEPVGRNTAPALTLAALASARENEDSLLLVMPSDHLIADLEAFNDAVAEAVEQAAERAMVTFGIVPDRPETGYGYIQVGPLVEGAATARRLAGFREKPDAETAQDLLANGNYLWNSGIFLVRQSVWLAAIETYRPDIAAACRDAIDKGTTDGPFIRPDRDIFAACPPDSIDYAVMERLDSEPSTLQGVVIPLAAGWSDAGAWEAVWEVSSKDQDGNVSRGRVVSYETENSLLVAQSRLLATLGCKDIVVVETPDAVLVADKNRTGELKQLLARISEEDQNLIEDHRLVCRPWGSYDCLEEGERFKVKHIVVKPGASLSLQLHHERAEHWIVVQGVALVTCGERQFPLAKNESTYIPKGAAHRLHNPGSEPLELIEVQSGDYLGEDDIVRLEDNYGRA
jgi:mannose-1-phosphate guanylyltransferase/mannose-6-phosphate isomerase